ncbi:hypothetical protein [Rickettsia felis]|uniref:hypothetical protein n=1 Tax=Rickettsia felis TaxID=42862 RepID=UPI001F2172D2|nr:hypothetical protein [Rickettsia felis]
MKKFFGIHEESDEILYNQLISLLEKLTRVITAKDSDKKEVEKLIDKIKNTNLFNQSDENGNTTLILAADAGLEEACLKLIPKMSDEAINMIENIRGQPALVKAMWRDLDSVCIELIPKMSKENINAIDNCGRTLLMLAAKKGMTTVSKMFINLMPPEMIIHADNEGNTTASYADTDHAFADTTKTIKLLQEKLLKSLASFINKSFLKKDHVKKGVDNFFKIVWATKFYKKIKVNKELLASYLQEQNNDPESTNTPESMIKTMNNFIKLHLFAIAGVCKIIQPAFETSSLHLSCLPKEAICCIISHLENEKWGVDAVLLGEN